MRTTAIISRSMQKPIRGTGFPPNSGMRLVCSSQHGKVAGNLAIAMELCLLAKLHSVLRGLGSLAPLPAGGMTVYQLSTWCKQIVLHGRAFNTSHEHEGGLQGQGCACTEEQLRTSPRARVTSAVPIAVRTDLRIAMARSSLPAQ